MEKTNVMRMLDQKGINYIPHEYDKNTTDGQSVARLLNQNEEQVFKTLVTVANDRNHYVFVVPVNSTLNLKKAAKAVGVKSIEMIHQKELLPLTGYIHGGCSPFGMKKFFKTTIDETAILFDTICVSGGKVGYQVELNPQDFSKIIEVSFCDLT